MSMKIHYIAMPTDETTYVEFRLNVEPILFNIFKESVETDVLFSKVEI